MSDLLWNTDQLVTDFGIDVPAWIEQDISCTDVAAIIQGGCKSGAYMPAVSYGPASDTMSEHGDDVVEYVDGYGLEFTLDTGSETFSQFCCKVLSAAVELWVQQIESDLIEAIEESQESDDD